MDGFTQDDRDMLIRLDERMSNHLEHHKTHDAKLTKWMIALTILLLGFVGRGILMWIL